MSSLTVLLHGLGGSEADMESMAARIPGRSICLRAPIRREPGYAWFDWRLGEDEPTVGDASTAAEHLLRVIAHERTTREEVVAIGWSQGATLVLEAMRIAPTVIGSAVLAAGFPVTGTRPTDTLLKEQRPWVHWVRGGDDKVIPAHEIKRLGGFLREHTALETSVIPGVAHELQGPMTEEIIRLLAT